MKVCNHYSRQFYLFKTLGLHNQMKQMIWVRQKSSFNSKFTSDLLFRAKAEQCLDIVFATKAANDVA